MGGGGCHGVSSDIAVLLECLFLVSRYLKSVKPFLPEEDYKKTESVRNFVHMILCFYSGTHCMLDCDLGKFMLLKLLCHVVDRANKYFCSPKRSLSGAFPVFIRVHSHLYTH